MVAKPTKPAVKTKKPQNNGTRMLLVLTLQIPQMTVEIPPPTQKGCARAAKRKVSVSKREVVLCEVSASKNYRSTAVGWQHDLHDRIENDKGEEHNALDEHEHQVDSKSLPGILARQEQIVVCDACPRSFPFVNSKAQETDESDDHG